MIELKIDQGVPIPAKKSRKSELYAFLKTLKPTESVLVPDSMIKGTTDFSTLVYCWARSVGLKNKFATRREAGGIRVWRKGEECES